MSAIAPAERAPQGVALKGFERGVVAATELGRTGDAADLRRRVACLLRTVLQLACGVRQAPEQDAFMAPLPAGIGTFGHRKLHLRCSIETSVAGLSHGQQVELALPPQRVFYDAEVAGRRANHRSKAGQRQVTAPDPGRSSARRAASMGRGRGLGLLLPFLVFTVPGIHHPGRGSPAAPSREILIGGYP